MRKEAICTSVPDEELAGTIRFAMKSTKELSPVEFRSQEGAVEKLGEEIGHEVTKNLLSKRGEDVFSLLASFWSNNGLGNLTVVTKDPIVIKSGNCYDCKNTRIGGAPVPCTFKRSLLETVLQDSLRRTVRLEETECHKKGGASCAFRQKSEKKLSREK